MHEIKNSAETGILFLNSRYVNHLRLKKSKTQWKKEDEEKIIKLHKRLGNKWVAIA